MAEVCALCHAACIPVPTRYGVEQMCTKRRCEGYDAAVAAYAPSKRRKKCPVVKRRLSRKFGQKRPPVLCMLGSMR